MSAKSQILEKIDEATRLCVGMDYFINTAKLIEEVVEADYTFLSKIDRETMRAIPLISIKQGELVENKPYALEHTPCMEVTDTCVGYYPSNVQELFPSDEYLKTINIDGYIGAAVFTGGSDKPFGIITCLYEQAPTEPKKHLEAMQFIAESIESRLEREYLLVKNYELKKSVDEKQLLLKEIHHRVKNNLQIISSILNLQKNKATDGATKEILDVCKSRVQSMALVHEMLYGSSSYKSASIKGYISKLIQHSIDKTDTPNLAVNLKVADEMIDLDVLIPLGLISSEVVSNFLKYSYAVDPRLDLSFYRDEEEYVFTIRDYGNGFPDAILNGHYESLGMELVHALVDQIGGRVSLYNDGGAIISIRYSAEQE